jgi:hypothetical protein
VCSQPASVGETLVVLFFRGLMPVIDYTILGALVWFAFRWITFGAIVRRRGGGWVALLLSLLLLPTSAIAQQPLATGYLDPGANIAALGLPVGALYAHKQGNDLTIAAVFHGADGNTQPPGDLPVATLAEFDGYMIGVIPIYWSKENTNGGGTYQEGIGSATITVSVSPIAGYAFQVDVKFTSVPVAQNFTVYTREAYLKDYEGKRFVISAAMPKHVWEWHDTYLLNWFLDDQPQPPQSPYLLNGGEIIYGLSLLDVHASSTGGAPATQPTSQPSPQPATTRPATRPFEDLKVPEFLRNDPDGEHYVTKVMNGISKDQLASHVGPLGGYTGPVAQAMFDQLSGVDEAPAELNFLLLLPVENVTGHQVYASIGTALANLGLDWWGQPPQEGGDVGDWFSYASPQSIIYAVLTKFDSSENPVKPVFDKLCLIGKPVCCVLVFFGFVRWSVAMLLWGLGMRDSEKVVNAATMNPGGE